MHGHIFFLNILAVTNEFTVNLLTLWTPSWSKQFLRTQPIPQRKERVSIIAIRLLTLFKEIIAVYTETHMKPKNTKYRDTIS
jgi:hypothetical protein